MKASPVLMAAAVLVLGVWAGTASAAGIRGDYLETRTCDIYTGPCFANAQVGLTGKEAFMAWSIDSGSHDGVDLAGLKVIAALKANDTLGFGGGVTINPYPIRSIVITDERATPTQRAALVSFVRQHVGSVLGQIEGETTAPIELSIDHVDMVGKLQAGKMVNLVTRKLGQQDCICTNETVYYPPLVKVQNAAPAFTSDSYCKARGLGISWTNPGTRSSFLATFAY